MPPRILNLRIAITVSDLLTHDKFGGSPCTSHKWWGRYKSLISPLGVRTVKNSACQTNRNFESTLPLLASLGRWGWRWRDFECFVATKHSFSCVTRSGVGANSTDKRVRSHPACCWWSRGHLRVRLSSILGRKPTASGVTLLCRIWLRRRYYDRVRSVYRTERRS